MATAKLQDMPPPGGYGPIQIDKVPLRRIMTCNDISILLFVKSTLRLLFALKLICFT